MQKKFVSNLALLLLLNLLIKPFWLLGIDREVQNVVGAENYGLYYTLFNFTFLFHMLLDLGINQFNNRNIAQNRQLLSKHLGGIALLKLSLGVVYAVITLLIGLFTGYSTDHFGLLALLCFNQFLLSFIQYLRSNLAALHLFRIDSLISVLDRGLVILICAVLLWGGVTDGSFEIAWFVYAQTAGYSVALLVAGAAVLRHAQQVRFRFNWLFALSILRQSYPYALLVLLMTFYFRMDAVMIEQLLPDGKAQSGIYAQGFRLLDAANIFAYLFSVLLLPIFSRMLKLKETVGPLVSLSSKLLLVPAIAVSVSAWFYATPVMDLLYDEHTAQSAGVFGWLMLGFIPISVTYIFGTLLTANGSLRLLNTMAFGGVLVNLVLNVLLIPKWGALGAAVASVATQSATALAQVLLATRVFSFSFNKKLIGSLLGFGLVSVVLTWWVEGAVLDWRLSLGVGFAGTIILALLIRLIDLRALVQLLLQSSKQPD